MRVRAFSQEPNKLLLSLHKVEKQQNWS